MRHVFALILVLGGCDSDEPAAPITAPPPVSAPKAEAPKREAPVALGAELASEVEKAKIRCKGADGIDRATDLDATMSGRWLGEYRYDDVGRDPVLFDATLTASGGKLSGTTSEPNTFAPAGYPTLSADIAGDVLTGGRVVFMKTYTTADVTNSVLYIGQLGADGLKIAGRWRTASLTGTFELELAGGVRG